MFYLTCLYLWCPGFPSPSYGGFGAAPPNSNVIVVSWITLSALETVSFLKITQCHCFPTSASFKLKCNIQVDTNSLDEKEKVSKKAKKKAAKKAAEAASQVFVYHICTHCLNFDVLPSVFYFSPSRLPPHLLGELQLCPSTIPFKALVWVAWPISSSRSLLSGLNTLS